jgi:hypothetical protein
MKTKNLLLITALLITINGFAQSEDDFDIVDGILIKYWGQGGNVVIPDTVTTIAQYAFNNCEDLTSVTISNSVTTINPYAFSNCNHLISLFISVSVTSIGEYAWGDCRNLQTITVEWDTPLLLTDDVFSGVKRNVCNLKVSKGSSDLYKEAYVWESFKIIEEYDPIEINVIETNKNELKALPNPMSVQSGNPNTVPPTIRSYMKKISKVTPQKRFNKSTLK